MAGLPLDLVWTALVSLPLASAVQETAARLGLVSGRGRMGGGVIDLPLLRSWMEAAGYRGMHEVEIFSAGNWWKRDPDEVLAVCKDRHRQCS